MNGTAGSAYTRFTNRILGCAALLPGRGDPDGVRAVPVGPGGDGDGGVAERDGGGLVESEVVGDL